MDLTLICIILFCIWGCGLHSYHLGRNSGIAEAVDHMQKKGYLDLDE